MALITQLDGIVDLLLCEHVRFFFFLEQALLDILRFIVGTHLINTLINIEVTTRLSKNIFL